MLATLDCKPHEMMKKNFISRSLQSNKYGNQLQIQLAARREFLIFLTLRCILTKKEYFHRLKSDSATNNIHPNNRQKPEITNKNTGKITCKYGQSRSVKGASKLCHDFHLHFQVLWLTPLF